MSDTRSRASSFQQRFNNFTQWTMQKLGRAEETKLDPEFENRVAKFRATKKELVALLKAASSFHTAKMKLQKANEGFHDALAMTGSHAKASPENLERFMQAQQQFFEKASKYMIDGDSLKSKLEEARGDEAEGGGEKGAESKGNDGEEEEHDVKDDVKETKKEG
eukprot:jgi/Bigna1/75052/fgenesh1_pg.32_\